MIERERVSVCVCVCEREIRRGRMYGQKSNSKNPFIFSFSLNDLVEILFLLSSDILILLKNGKAENWIWFSAPARDKLKFNFSMFLSVLNFIFLQIKLQRSCLKVNLKHHFLSTIFPKHRSFICSPNSWSGQEFYVSYHFVPRQGFKPVSVELRAFHRLSHRNRIMPEMTTEAKSYKQTFLNRSPQKFANFKFEHMKWLSAVF